MSTPAPFWCERVATLDPAVFAEALRRAHAAAPAEGVREVLHRREASGPVHWLIVVFVSEVPLPWREVDARWPALAKAVDRASLAWADVLPVYEVLSAAQAAALPALVRPGAPRELPPPPPPRPRTDVDARRPTPTAPPPPAATPRSQRTLF